MRVQLRKKLVLSDSDLVRIEMHSFTNIINVIMCELQYIRKLLHDDECLNAAVEVCHLIRESFSDRSCALENASKMNNYQEVILSDIHELIRSRRLRMMQWEQINECVKALKSVFAVSDIRVQELLARADHQDEWTAHSVALLYDNVVQVMQAIAESSHRRYGVVFSRKEQTAKDYLVLMNIHSMESDSVLMPPVFQDCIRDVVANARKYSQPGTTITVRLAQNDNDLELEVTDQGRGIPEEELHRVADFGYRAENTTVNETQGGGFGLTKAWLIARKFKGQMWIDSEEDQGTKVTIRIPLPR